MAINNFTVSVGPYSGTGPTQALTFYDSWTLDRNLDDGCTFSFAIPGYVPEADAINELDTDVWLYRDGILDQRFRIVQVNQSWGPSGEDTISVQAVCYRRVFAGRYLNTNFVFSQVSQGQIIWDLIDHSQGLTNGDLGVTIGNLGPTVLRDRNYEAGQNILDIIVDLCNVINGPSWEIDENLELVISQYPLFPSNPTPIVLGSTASSMSRPSGASRFANVALVSGNQQETSIVIAEATGLPSDPRGRWERRASYPSVSLQDTIIDHADGLLTEYQAPTTIWTVDVDPGRFFGDAQYQLGDFVRIVQPPSTAAPISVPAVEVPGQIVAISVDADADGDVRIVMRVLEVLS
jgi:hypothetical protein